jgi:ethanolamine utilization protein
VDSQVLTVRNEYPGKLLKAADLVLIPVLTQNTAAKVANTLADSLASTLIMQALMQGKNILAAKNAADPKDAWRIQANMGKEAPILMQALQANLKKLEDYGVKLVSVQLLAIEYQKIIKPQISKIAAFATGKKNIVDAQAIKAAAANGTKKLMVIPGTIVTPLARDLARDLQVEIVFS